MIHESGKIFISLAEGGHIRFSTCESNSQLISEYFEARVESFWGNTALLCRIFPPFVKDDPRLQTSSILSACIDTVGSFLICRCWNFASVWFAWRLKYLVLVGICNKSSFLSYDTYNLERRSVRDLDQRRDNNSDNKTHGTILLCANNSWKKITFRQLILWIVWNLNSLLYRICIFER